jgi:hypothetical protein
LKAEDGPRKAEADQNIQALFLHEVAADDADVASLVDLILQRFDEEIEFGEVLAPPTEVDVLVLEPDALLCLADQLDGVLRRIVGRQQGVQFDAPIEAKRGE